MGSSRVDAYIYRRRQLYGQSRRAETYSWPGHVEIAGENSRDSLTASLSSRVRSAGCSNCVKSVLLCLQECEEIVCSRKPS